MPGLHLPNRLLYGLLLYTALVTPALAEPEVVVVTAEKKAEDVQRVPAAVSAFSAGDMKAKQITSFRDLNFAVPNVTYTNTDLGGANFQIRGIGVSGGIETGIAVHENDVYLYDPLMASQSFYDIEQIEILRGPQSTLYGRGATGGVVNIISAKPDLEKFGANGELTYGNYNQTELQGMVNIPIVGDQLALRIAGDWSRHDGFVTNIADGAKIDGRDAYSFRASLRWEPTDGTIIDLSGSMSREDDSAMRAQKQLCTRDPTGVLGCLPDSLGTEVLNPNALVTNTAPSVQAFAYTLLQASTSPVANLLAHNLGFFDLSQPAADPQPNANPANLREVNTDFDPVNRLSSHFVSLNIKQAVAPWLEATFVGGYEDHRTFNQESFNNVAAPAIDPARLGTYDASAFVLGSPTNGVLNTLAYAASGVYPGTSPAYAAKYAHFFAHPGQIPESRIEPNRMGIISGDILSYSGNETAYDQVDVSLKQYSGELRFASSFSGPVNFLAGFFYLNGTANESFKIGANTADFPGLVFGALDGPTQGSLCLATGCIMGPTVVGNTAQDQTLQSRAIFGEAYYDILPGELKLTVGGRFTDDHISGLTRSLFLPGLVPIGAQDENATLAAMVSRGAADFDPTTPGNQLWQKSSKSFDAWTGRAVLNWTPTLDFTDQTTVYGSYSRGYKAGGFNNLPNASLVNVAQYYKPEGIDALELGTKNLLLDSQLQANLTVWYYNYEDMQLSTMIDNVGIVGNAAARLWGLEGEFLYSPGDSNWAFNLSFGHTHSSVGDALEVDTRNPSAGRSDVVVIKDLSVASNCVVYRTGNTFATPADANVSGFLAPPGGTTALAAHNVPLVNYGICSLDATTDQGKAGLQQLAAAGFSLHDPRLSTTYNNTGGAAENIHGNELPNTPPWSVTMGAQYNWTMDSGYALVPHVDVYWQDSAWARLFEDAPDRLNQWVEINALLTLNAPNGKWYLQAFVKNAAGSNAITGEYLSSANEGLYTNAFLIDPRTYGVRIGASF